MKRKITTLFFTLCTFFLLNAQKFVPLTDASGIGLTTGQLTSLENAAQEAVNILPVTDQPLFRVYDVGFYVHTPATIGGIPEVWEQVMTNVENDPSSDYYLILGRESSNEGVNRRIRAKLKLPYSSEYACLTEDERGNLEKYIEQVANDNLDYSQYVQAELAALGLLKDYFYKIIECNCSNSGSNCSQFASFTMLDLQLRGLGFRKIQIQLGGSSSWSNGAQGIFDYAGKNVVIAGSEYNIPEQVAEGKAIIEAAVQELPDTSIATSISGEVYILDNESFTNNEWEDAKERATAVDYVEYWVILTNNFGKSYLYSRFTIGEFVPVAVRGDGFDESRGMVTVSPWGLALKALGNAAVDAVVQAVIIRIVDPGANDWGTAWGKVSYLGAAWEGISSLLPWKKDLASTLVRTATSAFAVVLDNALNIPDYTVQQGLVDFGVGFAASGITQLVTHPKTVEKIGIGSVYAKLAFTKGIKRIHKSAPPALRRVTLAVQKIIIGNGGSIVKTYDKYEARQYAEIFYRAMPMEHYNELKSTFKLLGSSAKETSTSPNSIFSQPYTANGGVLIKMWAEPGTIDKLKAIGLRSDPTIHPLLKSTIGELPFLPPGKSTQSGWYNSFTLFKVESNANVPQQVNIQLGTGKGLNIFNEGLIYFEKIN